MSEIQFGDNFTDNSIHSGPNAGFQFDFHCERCRDAWRSEFVAYRSGQVSSWMGKAAGMLGGMLGHASEAAGGLAEAGYGKAHDRAFAAAVEQAKKHFHRCAQCMQYVCDRCWGKEKGLCFNCAPDVEVAIEAARAEGERQAAAERATLEGAKRAGKRDVKRDRQLVCPKCSAETHGAKFCPECGEKLAVETVCPKCSATVAPGTKFCPECGAKLA